MQCQYITSNCRCIERPIPNDRYCVAHKSYTDLDKVKASGYILRVDGTMDKFDMEKYSKSEIDDVGDDLFDGKYYCHSIGNNYYILMMSGINELKKLWEKSEVPVNKALQVFIPDSGYKGDVYIVRGFDDWNNGVNMEPFELFTLFDGLEIYESGPLWVGDLLED